MRLEGKIALLYASRAPSAGKWSLLLFSLAHSKDYTRGGANTLQARNIIGYSPT